MPVLVFDVNETLLDLAPLDRLFGSEAARRQWFQTMLRLAFTTTITGQYVDFGGCGAAALRAVGADVDPAALRAAMTSLPAHPDVSEGLRRLREAGFQLATLTNSTAEVGEAQLRSAGLRDLVDDALSADAVRRLKPAPEPYRHAAERLGVPVGEVLLVAAHDWDVAGAAAAGCRSAFLARPGQPPPEVGAPPDHVVADLVELADLLTSGAAG